MNVVMLLHLCFNFRWRVRDLFMQTQTLTLVFTRNDLYDFREMASEDVANTMTGAETETETDVVEKAASGPSLRMVFGNPITDATLQAMPEYVGKEITRKDRAHVALNMINAGSKDVNARTYVENLKAHWGTGVSTLCMVYNATGDPVTLVNNHDWYGRIGPDPYPTSIANGQWAPFLHVKKSGAASGSNAAVVYRGKNNSGVECDWMMAWDTPWGSGGNHAYTEIRGKDHYHDSNDRWGTVERKLSDAKLYHTDVWNGCKCTVSIGNGTSPFYEGKMTLDGA